MEQGILTDKEIQGMLDYCISFFPDPDLDKVVLDNLTKGALPGDSVADLAEHDYIYKSTEAGGDYALTEEAIKHLERKYPKRVRKIRSTLIERGVR